MPIRHLNILLLFTVFSVGTALAQFYPPQFSKPGNSSGNETSFPMDIVVDGSFRYWIASFSGLVEYDGNSFRTHPLPQVQNHLAGSDYLQQLVQTDDSTLWIGHSTGIARFNLYRKSFELIPIRNCKPSASLNFIQGFKDSKNRPVFICNELGPVYFNAQTRRIERLTGPVEAAGTFIFKISETKDQKYYLLHSRRGLLLYHIASQKILSGADLPPEFSWIEQKELRGVVTDCIEASGKKYISVKDTAKAYYEVVEYDPKANTLRYLNLKSNKGRLFFADSQGRLWIYGFGDQPVIYDPGTTNLFRLPVKAINPSIDFSLCYHIMEDHEHNIWLCTNAGVFTYNLFQNNFRILSESLPLNVFSDICQTDSNKLWFGTLQNGIYEYNTSTQAFINRNFSSLCNDAAYNDIWQIHAANDNKNIWIIHTNAKISRYNKLQNKFFFYKNKAFRGDFLSLCDGENGELYVSTQAGVLFKYNKLYDRFDSLCSLDAIVKREEQPEVNDIASVSPDELLIASSGDGLIKLNLKDHSYQRYQIDSEKSVALRSNFINVLKKFDNKTVFGGTSNGIFAYDIKTEQIESFSYDERFNLGNVFQITCDKYRNLIFTGTNKMYILNWKTKDVIDLGQKSNINASNLTEVFYSNTLDRLFVLSADAIYEIQMKDKFIVPDIRPILYSLETTGKSHFIKNGGHIFLPSHSNSFQINYGCSSFRFKDDLEYYYSLNGEDWQRTESQYINFSKLPGGEYLFKLKVVYTGNRKVKAETSLKIIIEKKFHETIWFYLALFLISFSLVYLFYRIRLNRLLAIEKVRFQLSRDLHDDMGSTLSTINILSAIASDKLSGDADGVRQYIQRISQNSEQMMESMDDIVWSINPANDSMKRIVYRMREFASGILEPKGINLSFESDDKIQHLKLNMAHRRDFFLIFKEAINNAVKYAECTRIRVRFYTEHRDLVLVIQDNGKGFEPGNHSNGNGLVNMRKRAKIIRAQFNLHSEASAGTTIEIRLKLKEL